MFHLRPAHAYSLRDLFTGANNYSCGLVENTFGVVEEKKNRIVFENKLLFQVKNRVRGNGCYDLLCGGIIKIKTTWCKNREAVFRIIVAVLFFMASKQKPVPGKFYAGTSNIVVPGNKQSFPFEFREKSRLHYYANLFNSVEINSTFYKIPLQKTFTRWAEEVQFDFRFTLKIWKEITHVKNLDIELNHIDRFLDAATGLGSKQGCLLLQFPGKITVEYYPVLEQILEKLVTHQGNQPWRIAVEFRNPSWYVRETSELLDEFGASMVLHDQPKAKNQELNRMAKFVYMRFHGPAGDYRGSYEPSFLEQQGIQIRNWLNDGKDVFAYFNNTIGDSFDNARSLQWMLDQ